jgi:hypothetical protein
VIQNSAFSAWFHTVSEFGIKACVYICTRRCVPRAWSISQEGAAEHARPVYD